MIGLAPSFTAMGRGNQFREGTPDMTVDEVTNSTKESSRSARRRRNREIAAAKDSSAAAQVVRKDRPAPVRREAQAGKGNIITRILRGIANYFTTTRAEIQKVTWPTRAESLRLSGIVLGVTVVSSIALGILDFFYGELFRIGFNAPVVFGVVALVLAVVVIGATWITRRT